MSERTIQAATSIFISKVSGLLEKLKERVPGGVMSLDMDSFHNTERSLSIYQDYKGALGVLEFLENMDTADIGKITLSCISSGEELPISALGTYERIVYSSTVGLQEIYADEMALDHQHCRLGHIKEDIFSAEPFLRLPKILLLDLGSIKYSDCPAKSNTSPIGLTAEELCNLIYFATNGACDKVLLYGINESTSSDNLGSLVELVKHLEYYSRKGWANRKVANLEQPQYLKKYFVNLEEVDEPISFIMNELSNKWWLVKGEKTYVPCTPKDYDMATRGNLSKALLTQLG